MSADWGGAIGAGAAGCLLMAALLLGRGVRVRRPLRPGPRRTLSPPTWSADRLIWNRVSMPRRCSSSSRSCASTTSPEPARAGRDYPRGARLLGGQAPERLRLCRDRWRVLSGECHPLHQGGGRGPGPGLVLECTHRRRIEATSPRRHHDRWWRGLSVPLLRRHRSAGRFGFALERRGDPVAHRG